MEIIIKGHLGEGRAAIALLIGQCLEENGFKNIPIITDSKSGEILIKGWMGNQESDFGRKLRMLHDLYKNNIKIRTVLLDDSVPVVVVPVLAEKPKEKISFSEEIKSTVALLKNPSQQSYNNPVKTEDKETEKEDTEE